MPFFSIVTVSFNEKDNIERTIKSVLEQSYRDFEYIVIDGASKDGTYELEQKLLSSSILEKVILSSEKDTGIYNAMNKGIAKASGEWIVFLNAGDSFVEKNVLREVASIIKNKTVDGTSIFYGDSIYEYKNLEKYMHTLDMVHIKEKMCFCHQSAFIRNSVMKKYMYDENYRIAADYNFFLSAYLDDLVFFNLNLPIAKFTIGGISTSGNYLQKVEYTKIRFSHGILEESIFIRQLEEIKKHDRFIKIIKKITPVWLLEFNRYRKLIKDGYNVKK